MLSVRSQVGLMARQCEWLNFLPSCDHVLVCLQWRISTLLDDHALADSGAMCSCPGESTSSVRASNLSFVLITSRGSRSNNICMTEAMHCTVENNMNRSSKRIGEIQLGCCEMSSLNL